MSKTEIKELMEKLMEDNDKVTIIIKGHNGQTKIKVPINSTNEEMYNAIKNAVRKEN